MPGIIFHFEHNDDDSYSGRHEDLDQWLYAMKQPVDIDQAVIINTSGVEYSKENLPDRKRINWQVAHDLRDLSFSNYSGVVCLIGPNEGGKAWNLWGFQHDVDWYVFGPASTNPQWEELKSKCACLSIPTGGYTPLHSVHAATVVMCHRFAVIGHG